MLKLHLFKLLKLIKRGKHFYINSPYRYSKYGKNVAEATQNGFKNDRKQHSINNTVQGIGIKKITLFITNVVSSRRFYLETKGNYNLQIELFSNNNTIARTNSIYAYNCDVNKMCVARLASNLAFLI